MSTLEPLVEFKGQKKKLDRDKGGVVFHECTEVTFDQLSDEVIDGYVATGEPRDKAGGYGIQAVGGSLIKSIHGDYFNVVGFPLRHFCKQLAKLLKEVSS